VTIAPLSDIEEAKRQRAERFGIPYEPPKPEPAVSGGGKPGKKGKGGAALTTEELEKAKKRAERFGMPFKAETESAEEEKTKKRAERFGTGTAPVDSEEEERRKKRAARFGMA